MFVSCAFTEIQTRCVICFDSELFDNYLVDIGQVPPWEDRKPGRKTTGGKQYYIRDEFKLWNILGFILGNERTYFREDYGLQFNWPKIREIYNFDINKFT